MKRDFQVWPIDKYPGKYPIRVLQNNTLTLVNNQLVKLTKELVDGGHVNPEFEYVLAENTFEFPSVYLHGVRVRVPEVFLAFAWAMSYAHLTIFEEGVRKRLSKDRTLGDIAPNNPLLVGAWRLYFWGLKLPASHGNLPDWPLTLPNPISYDDNDPYIEQANALFQNCVTFAILHEMAHLRFQHAPLPAATDGARAPIDATLQEREADTFAVNTFLDSDVDGISLLERAFAVVVMFCGSAAISSFQPRYHPPCDDRLFHVVNSTLPHLDLPEREVIHLMAGFGLQMSLQLRGNLLLPSQGLLTAEDYFANVLDSYSAARAKLSTSQ